MTFYNPDENSTQETKARKRREVTKLFLSSKLASHKVFSPSVGFTHPKSEGITPQFCQIWG
jgi:hypothetical protein